MRLGKAVLLIPAILLVTGAAYAWLTWPDVARLSRERPATTAFVERYQAAQRAAGKPDRVEWHWVPLDSISPALQRAVVVSEDIGFFSHNGFALAEMRDALRDAVRKGTAPRGASTITQQLAKNLWLSPSRNPLRKVKEALLTRDLERSLTKRRILEIYLNVVEFGPGIYGADAASRHYFDKPASQLTAHEAALLAVSLPRPRTWNPASRSASYARQVDRIENRVQRAVFLGHWITGGEPADATVSPDSALAQFLRADTLLPPIPAFDTTGTDSQPE